MFGLDFKSRYVYQNIKEQPLKYMGVRNGRGECCKDWSEFLSIVLHIREILIKSAIVSRNFRRV